MSNTDLLKLPGIRKRVVAQRPAAVAPEKAGAEFDSSTTKHGTFRIIQALN